MAVFRKYQKFFDKAAENVKENVGDDVQTDQLIREACRNVLEHAKQLFPEGEVKKAGSEVAIKRSRAADEDYSQRGSPLLKKRRTRPGAAAVSSDRPHTFSTQVKLKSDPIKREGPKWDPSRLNDSSTFVLGSRANKALGMGGTRGRIYIKHADLFKVNTHTHTHTHTHLYCLFLDPERLMMLSFVLTHTVKHATPASSLHHWVSCSFGCPTTRKLDMWTSGYRACRLLLQVTENHHLNEILLLGPNKQLRL
ncbi:deoxynucleotidyltransferase terminal-interacting protein 1 isoform X3 [Siniperca chuatsi]|nr:deoxynucleotidyltransferase terminal-interacting protein 1 isoform X3 [Siniperca chuatsi]